VSPLPLRYLPLGFPLGARFSRADQTTEQVHGFLRLGDDIVEVPGHLYDAWMSLRTIGLDGEDAEGPAQGDVDRLLGLDLLVDLGDTVEEASKAIDHLVPRAAGIGAGNTTSALGLFVIVSQTGEPLAALTTGTYDFWIRATGRQTFGEVCTAVTTSAGHDVAHVVIETLPVLLGAGALFFEPPPRRSHA
jgi:hypothetical protein